MVDGIASTTTNNNYQLLPPDLGLPYNHHHHTLGMQQNHPINLTSFHSPPPPQNLLHLHPFGGFSAKSSQQTGLSVQSLEDHHLGGVSLGQVNNNVHLVASDDHDGGGGKVGNSSSAGVSGGRGCKFNFSASASTNCNLNHDKTTTLENNNNNTSSRGEGGGAVDSWICSSD